MNSALAVVRALQAIHDGSYPDYEKVLTKAYRRFLTQTPNPVIVDVGANVGLHLGEFVQFGRTIAFEPIPHLAAALSERFPQADIRQAALCREPSKASFCYLPDAIGMSGLRLRDTHGMASVVQTIEVKIETIDRQLSGLNQLSYVKIDIEGGEIYCLRGGCDTITRLRPFISVEYGKAGYAAYGHTALTLFEWAREMNYIPSDVFGNLIETEGEWLAICDAMYWDYFLVPAERADDWRRYFT